MKAKIALVNGLDPKETADNVTLEQMNTWEKLEDPFLTELSDVMMSDPRECMKNMKYKVLKVIYLAEN